MTRVTVVVTIWSDASGPVDAPPIVLVHGSMDRSAGLLRLSRRLSDRFRVIRYDRRGYGRSTGAGPPFTIDAHIDDLAVLVEHATGGDGVCLAFGHSLGGNVALGLAQRRPELVDRVAIYETPMSWMPWWPEQTAGGAALGAADPADAGGGIHAPAGRRREVGPAPAVDPLGAAGRRRGDGGRAGRPPGACAVGRVTGSTQPVLALCGERAHDHHRRGFETLPAMLPGCRLAEIPDAGHFGPNTHADAVAAALADFIGNGFIGSDAPRTLRSVRRSVLAPTEHDSTSATPRRRTQTRPGSRRSRTLRRAHPLTMTPPPRANVPTALPMASVAPRASGMASLVSDNDVTNPYSKPRRNTRSPTTPTANRSPAMLMKPMPTRRVQIPASVLRTLPSRSANAAMLVLAVSSTAPKPIATTPMPLVETSNAVVEPASGDHEHRDAGEREERRPADDEPRPNGQRRPATEIAQGAVRVEVVAGAGGSTGRRSDRGGDDGSTKATTKAAISEPMASATNGPRQPNRLMSTATTGAPTSSASAHDISKMPIDRARHR